MCKRKLIKQGLGVLYSMDDDVSAAIIVRWVAKIDILILIIKHAIDYKRLLSRNRTAVVQLHANCGYY